MPTILEPFAAPTRKTQTKADKAYEVLLEAIVTLKLSPNASVTEANIIDLCGVGRTPVREALHRLETRGLLKVNPRQGIVIAPIDIFNQLNHIEVRRYLTVLLAKCVIARASDKDLNTVRRLAAEVEKFNGPQDLDLFVAKAAKLQYALHGMSKNPVLAEMLETIFTASRRFWYAYGREYGDVRTGNIHHTKLADAIIERDEEKALRAVNAHMDYLEEFTKAVVQQKTVK